MSNTNEPSMDDLIDEVAIFVKDDEPGVEPDQDLLDSGLVFHDSNGMLFDPLTGEIIGMPNVVDEATANRAMFLLFSNDAAISGLKRARTRIDDQIKARTKRKKFFLDNFTDGLHEVTTALLQGKKTNSYNFTYGKAGMRKTRRSIDVAAVPHVDLIDAALAAGVYGNLSITFDLSTLNDQVRSVLIGMARGLAEKGELAGLSIQKTKLSADAMVAMAKACPSVNVKGANNEMEFYVSTSGADEEVGDDRLVQEMDK